MGWPDEGHGPTAVSPYTQVRIVMFASDMESLPDMCPERRRLVLPGYKVSDGSVCAGSEVRNNIWQHKHR